MITFNNIVERFEIFAENHFFIKSFSFGSPDDVDLSKFTSFPLMHLVYTGATYDAGTKTYNLEVYILDVPADKNSKELRQKEVVSDAEQCAEDIIADIKNGGNIFLFAQDYEVVNATTTPLEEETKNVLSGVLLDLSVSIPYEWDACNAPINGVEPGGTEITYARRGVLRMLTLDGATDVTSVRTIKVTNGTLTDDGDGVVTLDTGGVETLEDLTDTNIINVQGGDVITWNSGVSKWMVSDGLQTLLSLLKSQSGTQLYNTSLDTDKGYIDLQATTAKMGLGQSFLKVTQTSPGVLTFSIACGAEGAETEFEAFKLQGTTTAGVADLLIQSGCRFKMYDANGYEIWIRPSGGMTGNVTLVTPATGGTLALQSEIPASVTDLSDVTSAGSGAIITTAERDAIGGIPAGGTTGQALIKTSGTDYDTEWADISIDVQYHNRYQTTAASLRAGATATTELYYTAQADGDGYAESASSDTPTAGYDIQRKLYYSEAAFADPDTGTWIQFAAIADNTTFANAKAALLAYLKDRTGGTVPISLKQTWEEVQQAPAFTGLLNESYGSGAAAAYGTRRLNGNYSGACMTIRRADGATQAIGFVGEEIDEAAITTFCTGSTCTVQVWHDQSQTGGTGSGNDATQTTPANQPTIYTGGALVKEGGRLALDFDGVSNELPTTTIFNNLGAGNAVSVFHISKCPDTTDGTVYNFSDSASSNFFSFGYNFTSGNYGSRRSVTGGSNTFSGDTYNNAQSLFSQISTTTTNNQVYKDGNAATLTTTDGASRGSQSSNVIGSISASRFLKGNIQEIVLYASDKSTDRTSIEGNISAYYQSAKLLDEQYGSGAEAAYSTRKLRRAQTECMVIRRASDSTTQTIGFDANGNIDEAAINTFCSGTSCTVETWKDQSGNGNDATQTTPANQPTIYTGGAIVKENGKPALYFNSTSFDTNYSPQLGTASTANFYSASVASQSVASYGHIYRVSGGGIIFGRFQNDQTTQIYVRDSNNGTARATGTAIPLNTQTLQGGLLNNGSVSNYINGSIDGTASITYTGSLNLTTNIFIGSQSNGTEPLFGNIQEFIFYASDKSSVRTSIESNVGGYFTQNTPLLDTYSGAAAAYSLRKLSSSFNGSAIRVRRASDNTEQDIGFNVFGELDTVSLASFCSGTDGFVKVWYDQSSTNDATQTTVANQPKIYDSVTGVITENGKPAVQFDGTNDTLTPTSTLSSPSEFSTFIIATPSATLSGYRGLYAPDNGASSFMVLANLINTWGTYGSSNQPANSALTVNSTALLSMLSSNGDSGNFYKDGLSDGSFSSTAGQPPNIGGQSNQVFPGTISEIIAYPSDKSTDRTNIEDNINTFYSIY